MKPNTGSTDNDSKHKSAKNSLENSTKCGCECYVFTDLTSKLCGTHTGSEEDYAIYKEALNQGTAEIRNSKRSYKQQLAFNIKHESKSYYAYIRSKQKG